jgi:peptidoglycan/LPS O-acetylase OafA/YrhL
LSQPALKNYIPALTGVRAMAAYLVFISHWGYVLDDYFPQSVQKFLREFHIGVTIFFVLSGFLIAFRYYDNFSLSKLWFKKYLKNRVARIYPMYAILTTGAFIYYAFTHAAAIVGGLQPVVAYLMNIFFLRGFFSDLKFTGISQGWSLTVEECFYFSAPFMFYFARKYGKAWLQPFVITGTGALLVLIFRNVNFYGFFGNFTFMMLFTFLGRCFEFFAGIMLALYIKKKGVVRTHNFKFTYLGFVLIFVCVWVMSILPILPGNEFGQQHPLGIITNNYLLAIAITLFFYGLITEDGTILKGILANKFVELLGKSSYIFYLIHLGYMYNMLSFSVNWLNDAVNKLYDKWGVDWVSPFQNDHLNLLYLFVTLNGIAILLFKNIEEPLNHYIRRSDFLVPNMPRNPDNDANLNKLDRD